MRKFTKITLALGIAASLSSCSRGNYAFNATAPAYLGSEQMHAPATLASVATTEVATLEATPTTLPIAAREAASALARPVAAPAAATATATKAVPAPAAEPLKLTRAERKELRQQVKKQIAAPHETQAEGKSQLVALILSFFLGVLGIHRFYLGYIGIGILELLTGGVFGILALIDFIRIIIGSLKPKDGEYAKKL